MLDDALANAQEIDVGDQVEVGTGGGTARFTVLGRAITAWSGPYPNWEPTVAYVLPETLGRIAPGSVPSVLFVRLADPETADQFIERAVASYPAGELCCTSSWTEVRQAMAGFSDPVLLVLGFLSICAVIAVTLVVANTIGGRMLTQRREIGLLKAAGMTPRQVTLLFLGEHLVFGVTGAVIGLPTGILASRLFLWRVAAPYDAAPVPDRDVWLWPLILTGILTLVAAATIVPAWHAGRLSAAVALSPRRRLLRSSTLGSLAIRLRLPASVVVGLKDLFMRPLRAWLVVAALTLSVTAACFALGMEATLDSYFDGSIWADNPHELQIQRAAVADGETRRILDQMPGIAGYVPTLNVSMKLAGEARWFGIRAVEGDIEEIGLHIRDGRMFAAPGEAIVGQGLLDAAGLRIGDDLPLVIDGHPLTLRIVGRYVELDNDGEMAMIHVDTLRTVLPAATADEYLVQVAPGTDLETIKADLLSASGGRFGVSADRDAPYGREVFELRAAVYSLSAVLLAVGLINLVTVALLGVRDRTRDLGILKALGMTPRELTVAELVGAALLAVLAWCAGVPLGMVLGPAVYDILAENDVLGAGLAVLPGWPVLLALIPIAMLVAALGAAMPARIAARLPVAGALRAE